MNFHDLLPEDQTTRLDRTLALRLGQLFHEPTPEVLATVALASSAIRSGHVAIDVKRLPSWFHERLLLESPLVGAPGDTRPLILENGRVYLHRYHQHETQLAASIRRLAETEVEVDPTRLDQAIQRFFPTPDDPTQAPQLQAVRTAASRGLCVITGGPGTGKTTLVGRILATLACLQETPLRIRLLAPTGKAAHRLGAAVTQHLDSLGLSEAERQSLPTQPETLHRALGARRGSRVRFRHHADSPIPADILIVDEASMVDLAMMRRLVDAVAHGSRLILLGDPHQLASVDAGSVLSSLCQPPDDGPEGSSLHHALVQLTHSWRFDAQGGIGTLARAIGAGDVERAVAALDESPSLTWVRGNPTSCDVLENAAREDFEKMLDIDDAQEALKALGQFKILCAISQGPRGVETLNPWCEQILARGPLPHHASHHYEGRPILIQRNDYTHGLYNGDQGLIRRVDHGWVACFESAEGVKDIATARLPDHTTAFAMSIHKSQGSEYERVAIVLPDAGHPILTRELLYTAVTRARTSILLYASEEALAQAIQTPTVRVSGLAHRLWKQA